MLRIAALLVALAAAGFAQNSTPEILALEKAWAQSVLRADVAALDKTLSDNLIYAHASGVVDTKQSYLAKLGSGKQRYDSLTQHKMSVRPHGDAVVTHCWTHVTGVNPAGPFDDKVMTMHTWVKTPQGWKLAAHQTTKVAEIPE